MADTSKEIPLRAYTALDNFSPVRTAAFRVGTVRLLFNALAREYDDYVDEGGAFSRLTWANVSDIQLIHAEGDTEVELYVAVKPNA